MFRYIIQKPYPYFVDKFSGKISSNISTVYRELQSFLTDIFYNYIGQIVGIITMGFILASVNWQTLVLFCVGVLGMIAVGRRTIKKANFFEARGIDKESTKNGIIVDSIANFASVKSFHKELVELQAVKKAQHEALDTAQKSYLWAILFWASMSLFVRHFIWPIAILMNMYFYFHGTLSLGQLTTLLSTILLFSSTVWDIIWQASQLNLKFARAEEAHRYLFGEKVFTVHEEARPKTAPLTFDGLELRNLTFAYPDQPDAPVLSNISLTIKKGEKIGIVGKSGGGKSTLIKILLDYYPINRESLYIDNKPATPRMLADQIAYVPQDTSLFHRSIGENIAYAADRSVSKEEIVKAAKKARAHDFIVNIKGQYDALVGERGVKLSGGQRQRIAIARAILKDAQLLVLDEATSALDSESEQQIQTALWELMKDRTAIVVAHRLSTIQKMDKIIVIDEGRIIESGTHADLLKSKGLYSQLWSHQSGGFIEE